MWKSLCVYVLCQYESEATLKVPLKNVSILLKDVKIDGQRLRKRNASAKRRSLLRAASGLSFKPSKRKKGKQAAPKKKSKQATTRPSRYQMWPVFLPFDFCKAIKAAGLVDELCLGSEYELCEVLRCFRSVRKFRKGPGVFDLRLSGPVDWLAFWKQAASEDWGAQHASILGTCMFLIYPDLV